MRIALLLILSAAQAMAAVLHTETFGGGANGWGDRDSGEMSVSHQAAVGNPLSAAMQGSFGFSFSAPTDAFKISSGTDFLGDYTTPGLTQIAFDLYAENIKPSDLALRLIDGSEIFTLYFSVATMPVDTWTTFTANLVWSAGWLGNQALFAAALQSVDQVEIQLTQNGTGAQLFYLDNIKTLDTEIQPGGGDAVPEPSSGLLVLFFGAILYGARRYMHSGLAEI